MFVGGFSTAHMTSLQLPVDPAQELVDMVGLPGMISKQLRTGRVGDYSELRAFD